MIKLQKVLKTKVRTSSINKSASRFFIAPLILFIFSLQVLSQTTTGRISGRISDATGAILPGVTVNIIDETKGIIRSSVTDNSGNYVVTNLLPGVYSVSIEHPGFKKALKTGYELTADGRLTVDLKLDIGDVNASVEVTSADGETVNTTSGEVARVIDGEQVRNLALNTRNYVELLSIIPGAVLTTDDPLGTLAGSGTGNTAINGNRTATTNLTIDGGNNIGPTNNAIQVTSVSIESIQEVKLQTSNFSAEYGRTSGPTVNVVTRGGTNSFHGSIFDFLRNDIVDAKPSFAPVKAPLRYNNYGYSFGGPIIKNKLFFFGGQEWRYFRRPVGTDRKTLPTTAELNGDFSRRLAGKDGVVNTADDGFLRDITKKGDCGIVKSVAVRTACFSDNGIFNKIPLNRITADGQAIANVYRTAIGQAAVYMDQPIANNATYQPPIIYNFHTEMLRIDYKFNDSHSIFGRYMHDFNDYATPYGPASESALAVTPTTRVRPGSTYMLQHTWLLNPRMTNEAKARTAKVDHRSFPVGDTWKRDTNGFTFPQVYTGETYDNGMPDVSISGFAGWRGPSFALIQPVTEIGVDDNLTMTRGNHTAKFRLSYMRSRIDQNGRPRYTGNISFATGSTNTRTSGNALADALLGNFRTYVEAADDPQGFFRSTQFDVFAMDNWKISRKLSIEIGARYQLYTPYYTQANNLTNFNPYLYDFAKAVTIALDGRIDTTKGGNRYNGLIRAGDGVPESEYGRVPSASSLGVLSVPTGGPRGLYENTYTIAPRFSFAYAPFDNGKTAIRGGYGIFYDTAPGDIPIGLLNNPPFNPSVSYENGNLSAPTGGTASALTPFGDITAVDPDLKRQYVMQYSLGVQRELFGGLFADIGYVGNLGRHLIRQNNINQVHLDAYIANLALPTAQRATSDNALRPYKGYSAINFYRSDTNSNYNALQLYVTKRKGKLSLTGSYTWSKALTDASTHGGTSEYPFNRSFGYGPATFDRRHLFVSTYTYRFLSFHKSKGLFGRMLSGYELTSKTRFQSGAFFTVTGSAATGGNRRADYLGGNVLVPEDERSPNNWINRDAFALAPNGRVGSSGNGIVEGPGMFVSDFSLRKKTRVNEKVVLRLQADLFNAFNRPNYTGLVTNLTDGEFGTLTSTNQPRQIQIGLKIEF